MTTLNCVVIGVGPGRGWRYSMVAADSVIEQFFGEPGINDISARAGLLGRPSC